MNNWTNKRLDEISDSCLGKMLDKEKNKGTYQPYLANLNVQWGDFKLDALSQMKFEAHEEARYGLRSGDLVICEGGEPGRCAVWRDERPNMKIQKALHRLRIKPGYCSDFLYYRMLLAGKNKELDRYFIGSTIKHLTGVGLKSVEFAFPVFEEQKSIAHILRTLDKKIELNNSINAELEAMAKLIYDYWFVQFDFPDAKGNPYKSSGGKMVYSEELKREIPEVWNVDNICTLFFYQEGPGITKEKYSKKGHNFINIRCIQDKDLDISNASMIDHKYVEKYEHFLLEENDIVVSTSGSLGRSAIVRKEHLPLMLNTSVIRFKPKVQDGFEYMYEYLKSDYFLGRLNQMATGSIQKNFGPTHLDQMLDVIPDKATLKLFSEKFNPLIKKVILNKSESQKLKKLRDWLLPMLMNGQVTIK